MTGPGPSAGFPSPAPFVVGFLLFLGGYFALTVSGLAGICLMLAGGIILITEAKR